MEEVEGLLWKLHPFVLNRDMEDILSWKNNKKTHFLLDLSTALSQELLVTLFLRVLFGDLRLR